MSEGMETDERIRAFVALDLPSASTAAVTAWQRSAIADRSDLRPIRPEALHLTLAFLGHVEAPDARRAADVVAGVAAGSGPIPLRLVPEPLGFPQRRPRVVAFDVFGPAAVSLAEGLAKRLAGDGVIEAQRRRFRLHLSVARVRGSPRSGGRGRRLTEGLPPLPEEAGHTFGAVRIALYRSRLGPGGASYTALTAFELPPLEGAADEVI